MRTFIAVDIPQEAKLELDALFTKFKNLGGRVSWVRAKNLHITMKFIGEMFPEKLDDLSNTIKAGLDGCVPQHISLSHLGGFPDLKRPRVLWVGIAQGKDWLTELAAKIDRACAVIKIPKEKRKPSPHLTIGRVRELNGCEGMLEVFSDSFFEYPPFEVNSVTIYKSDLKPQGAAYTKMEKILLN